MTKRAGIKGHLSADEISKIKTNTLKKISGAAVSDKEKEKIKGLIPNSRDSKSIVESKLNALKTIKMKRGDMANTKKMNELEELGRVDAEKAWTKKGKKNLKAEKKRVVDEIKKASTGAHVSTRGFGAARTSGMGLQDEKLKPGQNYEILKGGDYIKDLI